MSEVVQTQIVNHIADILFIFVVSLCVVCFTIYKIVEKITEYKKTKLNCKGGLNNDTRKIHRKS